jgi:hypothetical protein
MELLGSLFLIRCSADEAAMGYVDADDDPAAPSALERDEGPEVPACTCMPTKVR